MIIAFLKGLLIFNYVAITALPILFICLFVDIGGGDAQKIINGWFFWIKDDTQA